MMDDKHVVFLSFISLIWELNGSSRCRYQMDYALVTYCQVNGGTNNLEISPEKHP